jgi:DNA polymerase-3 subunit delta
MTFEKILKDLKNKVYYPIYFLHGEEAFFIDQISNFIQKNVLNDQEKELNQMVLYGKDTDIKQVISAAKRFPMMASQQVIIVKEAQHLAQIDLLSSYAEKPLQSTILVFCYKYKKIDGRLKVSKILKKNHVLFESKKLYDNQVPK